MPRTTGDCSEENKTGNGKLFSHSLIRWRQVPVLPEVVVIRAGQFSQQRVGIGIEPLDHLLEIGELHRGATGGAIVFTAPNVKENLVASLRVRVVVIVLDEHEPLVGDVIEVHVFLLPPRRQRRTGRQGVEMIIGQVRELRIVDPGIAVGDLMIGPGLRAFGKLGGITENHSDLEEARRITTVTAHFLWSRLGRMQSASPREPAPAKHNGPGFAIGLPFPSSVPMKKLQGALGRAGIGSQTDDHLLRIKGWLKLICPSRAGYNPATQGQGYKKNCHQPVHLRYGKCNHRKRQTNRTMRTQPLPLLVLTGFLGSGKTTTLSHWLSHTDVPLKRTAVIINDFGSVNVDAALLARRQLELRSITGGCVCCQSFEDLVAQVDALAKNPDFDFVWIETSGLADPEEVLDHLSAPELQNSTVIRRLVLVIDASDFPCSWRGRAVQEEQVRYADLIILNKTDRIDEKARQRVELTLREMNPSAQIVLAKHGEVEPALLSDKGPDRISSRAHAHLGHDHAECDHEHHDHDGHDHHHHHDEELPHAASTLFLPLTAPVERATFERFLGSLPTSVFRAKGFIRLAEAPDKLHTFQQVRDQAELLLLPLENSAEVTTGLVFIGPHLNENRIRELAQTLNPAMVSS